MLYAVFRLVRLGDVMQNLGRRKFLKDTTTKIYGFSIIAGFPQLFPLIIPVKATKSPPPPPTKKSTKVVSPSQPTKKTGKS